MKPISEKCKISVCMAVYNGSTFLKEQIDSILSQLSEKDELIIVDDCSKDNSTDIIKSYKDTRIILITNAKNLGVNNSFNRAIEAASGDVVLLSDQDDIWCVGRLQIMVYELLKSGKMLLSSNLRCIDIYGQQIEGLTMQLNSKDSTKYLKNIFNIYIGIPNYYGCTMAFLSSFKKVILPFPSFIESHDLWIALAANICKSNLHLDYVSQYHRIHGNNTSIIKRSFCKKVRSRVIFTISILVLMVRCFKLRFLNKIVSVQK